MTHGHRAGEGRVRNYDAGMSQGNENDPKPELGRSELAGDGPSGGHGATPTGSSQPATGPSTSKDLYEIAPVDLPARPPIVPPSKPGINRPGVLEGFDEDADFDNDPDVKSAAKGGAVGAKAGVKPGQSRFRKTGDVRAETGADGGSDSGAHFVEPGLGSSKVWTIIGGLLLVLAVVAAAMNQRDHPVLASLLVLYNGFLHTGTGVAAVGVGAVIAGKRVGPLDLAASRMFAAVAGMLLLANCTINLIGNTRIDELTLGAIVYIAIVAGTFRFWGQTLATVVSAHFVFWLVVQVGMEITAAIGRAPTPAVPR